MIRMIILIINLLISLQANSFAWSNLWATTDQQGQKLMDDGHYAKAKETFERNDWAAAAAYKAGDYQKAAQLLKQVKDFQGYYNQGNALAHLGQYEQAIEAYNKALNLNSHNPDALYNRKLIEDLLKKDKKKQDKSKQNKDQQSKDKQNKDQQNKDQQSKDQQNKDQQNKDQQSKDQQSKDQQNKDQQNKDQQSKDQQSKDQKNKDQKNKDQQNKDQQNKDQQSKNKQSKEQQDKDQQDKDQQNKEQPQDQNELANKKKNGDVLSDAAQEKQQAKEQWLKLIPDDPGGLMREKFLRDHLRRERGWYQ